MYIFRTLCNGTTVVVASAVIYDLAIISMTNILVQDVFMSK